MKQTWLSAVVVIVAIISITALDLYALHRGVDGTLFAAALATIGALVGGFCGFTLRK